MSRVLIIFGLFSVFFSVECSSVYDNYTLIRLVPKTPEQLEATSKFQDPDDKVEVLKVSRDVNDTFDVLLPPEKYDFVKNFANDHALELEVKQHNYGRTFEEPSDRTPKRRVLRSFDVFKYHSYSEILEYIDHVEKKYPDLVNIKLLGKSFQGKPVKLVRISADPDAGNPVIFIDAGIHAREWVAPATALYIIHRLTTDENAKNQELRGVDWYIMPQVNPDGYEFTRASPNNRMWRKTRSKNPYSNCVGVDGNRNYGFKWAVSGVSSDPCHKEIYPGYKPFSEPETRMVRNVMMEYARYIKLYVSLHSYGQHLVYPWGYTGEFLPKQWRKLDFMARTVSAATQKAGGNPFKVVSAGKWYPAAGGSDDYAFGVVGIPYSYTMELTQGYEFNFPEHLLRQVLPQFYEGFKAFGEQIAKEFPPDSD